MMRKFFILALILIAVNYFYGDEVDAWWQGWRSGDKIQEIGQDVSSQCKGEIEMSYFGLFRNVLFGRFG